MWAGESLKARWLFTSRFSPYGASVGLFENFNMAPYVGDEVESVSHNRNAVATLMRGKTNAVVWPHLTHSTTVLEVTSAADEISSADILFTVNPDVTLATLSADCVPLIALAKNTPFILTAHIGWKGAAQGIGSIIEHIFRLHTDGDVDVILGPAICGNCYQVEKLRQEQVLQALPESQVGESGIDIRVGLAAYFKRCGHDVQMIGPCTFESSDLFSYRRDTKTGRQAALVQLT